MDFIKNLNINNIIPSEWKKSDYLITNNDWKTQLYDTIITSFAEYTGKIKLPFLQSKTLDYLNKDSNNNTEEYQTTKNVTPELNNTHSKPVDEKYPHSKKNTNSQEEITKCVENSCPLTPIKMIDISTPNYKKETYLQTDEDSIGELSTTP